MVGGYDYDTVLDAYVAQESNSVSFCFLMLVYFSYHKTAFFRPNQTSWW